MILVSLLIVGVNVGCGAHADDIRTCTIGAVEVETQAASLQTLTSNNSIPATRFENFWYQMC